MHAEDAITQSYGTACQQLFVVQASANNLPNEDLWNDVLTTSYNSHSNKGQSKIAGCVYVRVIAGHPMQGPGEKKVTLFQSFGCGAVMALQGLHSTYRSAEDVVRSLLVSAFS